MMTKDIRPSGQHPRSKILLQGVARVLAPRMVQVDGLWEIAVDDTQPEGHLLIINGMLELVPGPGIGERITYQDGLYQVTT